MTINQTKGVDPVTQLFCVFTDVYLVVGISIADRWMLKFPNINKKFSVSVVNSGNFAHAF